ncbi:hypothetical protein MPDQ_006836 [Monascus purpureus]|uniref:Uncharacterized protein n=1 Tax=Monascus purpureus TaxID=5098 RepID=A0A507QXA8_MONPU|nr:hypothetical protein MPDQ_006836 [Monascus purpureus]BDD59896.1 hypothetical protein MAP00_005070 [Monascus purpureus]
MSADLFAEFGFGQSPQNPPNAQQRESASQTNSLIPDLDSSEDALRSGSSDPLGWSQFQTSELNAHANRPSTTSKPNNSNTSPPVNGISREQDSNVLFDATLEKFSNEDDDDWGEFESAEVPPVHSQLTELTPGPDNSTPSRNEGPGSSQSTGSRGLSGAADLIDAIEDEVPPREDLRKITAERTDLKSSTKTKNVSIPRYEESTDEFFDEWGDFVGGKLAEPSTESAKKKAPLEESASADNKKKLIENNDLSVRIGAGQHQVQSKSDGPKFPANVRPTNIPPPSVLMQLFPPLFEQFQQEASRLRGNPQQKDALGDVAAQICCTLKVAARIIAGRSLRWKRDTILSQSMRIGPARAGKPGGMKLNTVNKSENVKEKQEALDVLGSWRERAGFFNSIMLSSGKRPIQVIAENVRVITAGPDKGALKAPHACAFCGLKRDERLPGVIDENVLDSFGEWWTDHWGHTDCKQFWESNMKLLSHR